MSAYVVNRDHIHALLRAGLAARRLNGSSLRWDPRDLAVDPLAWKERRTLDDGHDGVTADNVDAVGQMLTDECVKSVKTRYPQDTDDQLPGRSFGDWREPYHYDRSIPLLEPVAILKMISCYEYQSCEHDGWNGSESRQFCEALRAATIRRLPGYEDAPWEYTRPQVEPTPRSSIFSGPRARAGG